MASPALVVHAPERCRHCDAPITQPAGRGRPRSYCTSACRQRAARAAQRRLEAVLASVVGGPELADRMRAALAQLPDEALRLASDPDEAALRVLSEAWIAVEKLSRIAAVARPELAARCSAAAAALAASLS